MDGPIKARGGRVGKSSGSANPRKDLTAGKGKGGILSAANQRAILKHAGAGDVAMKVPKTAPSRGLAELKVTGWNKSKASTNPDGGVSSLITWLEKKASNRLSSRVRSVKIKKVRRQHHNRSFPGHHRAILDLFLFASNFKTTTATSSYGLFILGEVKFCSIISFCFQKKH
jgi:hypothetical protein